MTILLTQPREVLRVVEVLEEEELLQLVILEALAIVELGVQEAVVEEALLKPNKDQLLAPAVVAEM